MNIESGVIGIHLGGPEDVRMVNRTVDGIEERPRFLFRLFHQGLEGRKVVVDPLFMNGNPGDDGDV
jgi:hypothetical protein